MAAQDRSTALRVQRMGMAMIEPAEGLAALLRLVGAESTPAVVAGVPFLWDRLAAQQQQQQQRGAAAAPSLYSEFVSSSSDSTSSAARTVPALATAEATPGAVSTAALLADVLAVLRGILGSADISAGEPLMAAGLDSLGAVELRNSLESRLGVRLSSTLIFDYPTAAAVADHIASLLSAAVAPASSAPVSAAAAAAAAAVHAERVTADVAAVVSEILGTPGLDPQQPLMAAGLDSLGAVELKNSLEGRLGLQLPGTLVFDYPTVAALGAYIASRLQPAAAVEAGSAALDLFSASLGGVAIAGATAGGPQPLAVAAMATRSPKASAGASQATVATGQGLHTDVSARYQLTCSHYLNLQDALRGDLTPVDATSAVPLERWDLQHEEASLGTAPIRQVCPGTHVQRLHAPLTFCFWQENAALLPLLPAWPPAHLPDLLLPAGSQSSWTLWTSLMPPPLPSATTKQR